MACGEGMTSLGIAILSRKDREQKTTKDSRQQACIALWGCFVGCRLSRSATKRRSDEGIVHRSIVEVHRSRRNGSASFVDSSPNKQRTTNIERTKRRRRRQLSALNSLTPTAHPRTDCGRSTSKRREKINQDSARGIISLFVGYFPTTKV